MDISKELLQLAANKDGFQKRLDELCFFKRYKGIVSVDLVINLLNQFDECAGYSFNRRGKTILELSKEEGVQDLIFFMLKPSISDLVPEQPVGGHTRKYSIQDFRSYKLRLVVEAKLIRDKAHGKKILQELNDDIGNYKSDPYCDDLVFFIFDPNRFLESPGGIIESIEGEHTHNHVRTRVHCIIK